MRRLSIDFEAVAAEAGTSRGKICKSPWLGWCVQERGNAVIASITPPPMELGETNLRIEDGAWIFEP